MDIPGQAEIKPAQAIAPASDEKSSAWLRAAIVLGAFAMLGWAIHLSDGVGMYGAVDPSGQTKPAFRSDAMMYVAGALLFTLAAAVAPLPNLSRRVGLSIITGFSAFCFAANLIGFGTRPPAVYLKLQSLTDYLPFVGGVGAIGALGGVVIGSRDWLRHAAFAGLLLAFLITGRWIIQTSPMPIIDVYFFQRDSTAALADGKNPYAITFADPYQGQSPWYGEGMSVNGVLQFGYPYMPLTLLMAMPAHYLTASSATYLFGEIRHAQLFCILLASVLLAYSRMNRASFLGAVLLLAIPRTFLVIEQSWTEPFQVVLLAATLFCACRLPVLLPVIFGLMLVSKQYMPAAAVLGFLLVPMDSRSRKWLAWPSPLGVTRVNLLDDLKIAAVVLGKAILVGGIVTLPFVLWDFSAFWNSAVALQFHQPYRYDSLGFLAWFGFPDMSWKGPSWLAFVTLAIALALAIWRCPRTPAGFAIAMALAFFALFAFSKQAFCNYYYLVLASLCCAVAMTDSRSESWRETIQSTP